MNKFICKFLIFVTTIFILDYILSNIFLYGLKKNYGFSKKAEILFIGNSRTDLGIDENIIENNLNIKTAKYAYGGANVFDRYAMIKNYFSKNTGVIKYVVYDVDHQIFSSPEKLSINSYKKLYPFMDTNEVDEYLRASSQSNEEYYSRKILKLLRFDTGSLTLSLKTIILGNRSMNYYEKISEKDIKSLKSIDNTISYNENSYKCFIDTICYVKSHGAKLILVKSALPDFIIEKHRVNDEYSDEIFKKVSNGDKDVIFIDFSELFANKLNLFKDKYHLNRYGQIEFSGVISQKLYEIIETGL